MPYAQQRWLQERLMFCLLCASTSSTSKADASWTLLSTLIQQLGIFIIVFLAQVVDLLLKPHHPGQQILVLVVASDLQQARATFALELRIFSPDYRSKSKACTYTDTNTISCFSRLAPYWKGVSVCPNASAVACRHVYLECNPGSI